MSKKRGQITVFIIIGMIILFSVGTYMYLREQGANAPKFLQPKTPPVEAFIELCTQRTAQQAINLIGTQGGFLSIPPEIALNPTRYVSAIPGFGGPGVPKIPFWFYRGRTEIPSIEFIQREIENYVAANINYCLKDLI